MDAADRAAVAAELRAVRLAVAERYPTPIFDVRVQPGGVSGVVGVSAQADLVRARLGSRWPAIDVRLTVLAERRPRRGLWPLGAPLDVWRDHPGGDGRGGERATELLAGDPPALLLAVRGGACLVRAPGAALGWVDRGASFRLGVPHSPADLGLAPVREGRSAGIWSWDALCAFVLAQRGRPYVWGATGGAGYDCSGLVWRAFAGVGLCLPRNSRGQRRCGERVAGPNVAAGDLAGAISRRRRLSHVALALDAGSVVHACSETGRVRVEPRETFEARYQVLGWRRIGRPTSTAAA